MKNLMCFSIALFFLTATVFLAVQITTKEAKAQSANVIAGIAVEPNTRFTNFVTESGDYYLYANYEFVYVGNVFSAAPVNVEPTTWGQLKTRFPSEEEGR